MSVAGVVEMFSCLLSVCLVYLELGCAGPGIFVDAVCFAAGSCPYVMYGLALGSGDSVFGDVRQRYGTLGLGGGLGIKQGLPGNIVVPDQPSILD